MVCFRIIKRRKEHYKKKRKQYSSSSDKQTVRVHIIDDIGKKPEVLTHTFMQPEGKTAYITRNHGRGGKGEESGCCGDRKPMSQTHEHCVNMYKDTDNRACEDVGRTFSRSQEREPLSSVQSHKIKDNSCCGSTHIEPDDCCECLLPVNRIGKRSFSEPDRDNSCFNVHSNRFSRNHSNEKDVEINDCKNCHAAEKLRGTVKKRSECACEEIDFNSNHVGISTTRENQYEEIELPILIQFQVQNKKEERQTNSPELWSDIRDCKPCDVKSIQRVNSGLDVQRINKLRSGDMIGHQNKQTCLKQNCTTCTCGLPNNDTPVNNNLTETRKETEVRSQEDVVVQNFPRKERCVSREKDPTSDIETTHNSKAVVLKPGE